VLPTNQDHTNKEHIQDAIQSILLETIGVDVINIFSSGETNCVMEA
jgi:hypothetical protein